MASWRSGPLAEADTFKIAVNVSAVHITAAEFPAGLAAAVTGSGIPPGWLCVEITESALLDDIDAAAAAIDALHAIGVRVAIDDFGTGQSSLSYRHRLPVDVVKLDRSLLLAVDDGPRGAALLRGAVQLVRAVGVADVVAEGVETPDQATLLGDIGCNLAQGFLYHPPLPGAALHTLLHGHHPAAQAPALTPRPASHSAVPT